MNDESIISIMKEPSPIEVTEYEERIRRNLLVFSMIVWVSLFLGVSPTNKTEVWGLTFENLTEKSMYIILLLVIVYEFVHYSWLMLNKFAFWRVRLTGTKLNANRGSAGVFGSSDPQEDVSGEAVNSTIYIWMFERANSYRSAINSISRAQNELDEFISKVRQEEHSSTVYSQLTKKIEDLKVEIERLNVYLGSWRVNESMKRFDNWFDMMIKSQSRRWLILDLAIPLISGFVSIFAIAYKLATLDETRAFLSLPSCIDWFV